MELLLDDNYASGTISCPEEIYGETGDMNTRLSAKQNYEFLLRVLEKYPVLVVGISENDQLQSAGWSEWEGFCTDCYVTGKYQETLQENGYFQVVVQTLLQNACSLPDSEKAVTYLKKMIARASEYYEIDDNTRPILVYGSKVCHEQLVLFASELAAALRACHQRVEFFSGTEDGGKWLSQHIHQHYKAVISMQTALVINWQDMDRKSFLDDLIAAPVFRMEYDHPVKVREDLYEGGQKCRVLVHDRNYQRFTQKYYQNIEACFHFAPAGMELPCADQSSRTADKIYDLSFVGTYYDYRPIIIRLKSVHRYWRFLSNHYLNEMKHHPNQTAEAALKKVLERQQIALSDEEFLAHMRQLRYVFYCVMHYYREKIIRTILEAGIVLHVYGDSWEKSPFAGHPCLRIHPEVNSYEALLVMRQSRISLNIMSWHKDGLTERVLNAMLNHSVVLSDKSTQLEEEFVNGEDLVLFDLERIDVLPAIIRELLDDTGHLEEIAENGYRKAYANHRWINRAKQFLEILESS